MTSTGKKARRAYGTRFAAKRAKGGKGKVFDKRPTERITDPERVHAKAIAAAKAAGLHPRD